MTRTKFLIIAVCLALTGAGVQDVYAQMTDDQVVAYVKQASQQGKSQTEISRELLAKGVTMDQVNRLKAKYSGEADSGMGASGRSSASGNARQAKKPTSDRKPAKSKDIRDGQTDYRRTDMDNRRTMLNYENEEELGFDYDDMEGGNLPELESRKPVRDTSVIFGHDIFQPREDGISFEPNENVATPDNYKLGPGDEVVIDIWGYNEANIQQTISPEGRINIEMVGPVYLTGLTVKEAESKIKKVLASKYSSIGGERPNTEVSVSLGAIRTIQVNVMGDVDYPGAYRMSSFSTVFSALYAAGGVSETGSLRAIQVIRNGRKIATVDIYAYIFDGKSTNDVRLQDGDVILVPAYVNVVKALGGVKRSMKYEMAEGETVADLLKYCGGFTGRAFRDNVSVSRNSGTSRQILTASQASGYGVVLEDGDEVTVGVSPQHYANRLEIKGYVVNPGEYEYGGDITTVKQLVSAAGGLKVDAFLGRAVLQREKADRTYETLSVDLGGIMNGTRPDVTLRKGDVLTVRGKYEMEDRGTLTINGMVVAPGIFDYAENTTVEDLIVLAGGLLDGASMSKVEVSRRVVDPYSLDISEKIGESFTFSIKDGLAVDGADKFYLEPYDVVSVRRAPAFQTQQFVTVEGEVAFPGAYVLQTKGERLSSVIERAGGLTSLAFVKGGKLTRMMSEEELETARKTLETERRNIQRQKERLALTQGTSAEVNMDDLETMQVSSTYTVAVDFEKAMANPGSVYDIILREGDVLSIPENVGTVAIKGEVLFPNTVAYVQGKPVSYYISQAGGFSNDAKQPKVYVVYMNGSVGKGSASVVEPGCEIVVPRKPERKAMSTTEIMSLGTSTASLATMIVSLVNMLSK